MPTQPEADQPIRFAEEKGDVSRLAGPPSGRKKGRSSKRRAQKVFLDNIEIPPELLTAKQKILDDVFGGEETWLNAHDEGRKKGAKYGLENITGIGFGQKMTHGKPTAHLCVVVQVLKKPKNKAQEKQFRRDCMIPKTIKVGKTTVLTDIQKGHRVKPQVVIAGDYCGLNMIAANGQFEAGTIGFFCTCIYQNEPWGCLLTGNHVIGDFLGTATTIPFETEVQHPAAPNGIVVGFYFKSGDDHTDGAVAFVKGSAVDLHRHQGFTVDPQLQHPYGGQAVMMYGATTGQVRHGTIVPGTVGLDQTVPYMVGNRLIHDTFIIESADSAPFSQGGDSGAGIVEADTGRPLGLLIGAAGGTRSLAQNIGAICDNLEIKKILG